MTREKNPFLLMNGISTIYGGCPYVFKNGLSQAMTSTDARYRAMITQFFLPKLDDTNGVLTTRHIFRETIQLLLETFFYCVLSCFDEQSFDKRVYMFQQSRGGHLPLCYSYKHNDSIKLQLKIVFSIFFLTLV